MDVFAVDEFVALVEILIGLSWPIRLDQFDTTAQQLGWSPTGNTGIFTGNFASGEGYIMVTKGVIHGVDCGCMSLGFLGWRRGG